jgi:hypothetical protein
MKLGHTAKRRIHVKLVEHRWLLMVDDKAVVCSHDRTWLQRFAVNLRKMLADDPIP